MANWWDTTFGGGAEKEAADKDRLALQQYQGQSTDILGSTYQQGRADLTSGINAYAPLAQLGKTYSAAAPSYMAAIGVGSPADVAAARANFASTPGYQELLDATTQASNRTAAAGGMLGTGNAQIDAILKGAGVTSQQYQQYINNLQNAGQMGLNATGTAAQGQQAGYTNLANLGAQYGQNMTGVYGNVASGDINANQLQAQGEVAGAKNLLNAGLSVATLAMGGNPFGGSLTGGGGGGQPFNFANTPAGSAWSGFKTVLS